MIRIRRRRRGPRGLRGLQARLLFWFLGAITLAIAASLATTFLTSVDNNEGPVRVVSHHVQQQVARTWDNPQETDRYIADLRETTGLDIRVRRDPAVFAEHPFRPGAGMVFENGVAYVPVMKHGQVVGALELRTGAHSPGLWRIAVALLAALLALGAVARRVSMRLSRPLEQVASTAERFGAGDLAARTGVERFPSRWVAAEVRDLGLAFDGMADRISRVVLEQRELLAAISHELRSPLGRARVALEIARERPDPEGRTRSLDDVERELGEVDAILGDLLASARAGLADLRRQPVDLKSWLEQRIASESESETGAPVTLEGSGASPSLAIDPALLGRALHNLLANAWAHGHPKSEPLVLRWELSGEPGGGRVRVSVRDRGPGFPAEVLPRAFEPFVAGGGPARSPGAHGIGLGLSLVRRIVEAHGGSVSAANVEGGPGAIVGFELPLA